MENMKIKIEENENTNIKIIFVTLACYITGLMFYSFDPLMQSFPSVITDDLMSLFAISSVGVGFIAASYLYSYNVMQIPAGILCDLFGIKKVLTVSSILCVFGLLLFAYSSSLNEMIFSRILMGLGASCAAVILIFISKEYFSEIYLPLLVGIAQFSGNIGSICGQFPLSVVSNKYGWRISILFLTLIPIIIFICSLVFLKNPVYNNFRQHYVQKTILQIKEVSLNKINWLIALYALLLWAPFYSFSSLWGIPFVKATLNLSVENASKFMTLSWIGSGIGSILIGILSSYTKKKRICIFLSAFLGLFVFPIILYTNSHSPKFWSAILFLFGIASAGQALSFVLISDHNKKNVLGTAVGFLNTVIMIGPMLLDPFIGWILKLSWNGEFKNNIPMYSISDYKTAFIIIPILYGCAALVALFYREK